jgi:hypothetical protein
VDGDRRRQWSSSRSYHPQRLAGGVHARRRNAERDPEPLAALADDRRQGVRQRQARQASRRSPSARAHRAESPQSKSHDSGSPADAALQTSLEGRAILRLARQLPPSGHPLRPARRQLPRAPRLVSSPCRLRQASSSASCPVLFLLVRARRTTLALYSGSIRRAIHGFPSSLKFQPHRQQAVSKPRPLVNDMRHARDKFTKPSQ